MRNSTISLVVLAALAIGGGVGYQLAKRGQVSTASPETLQKVLYWYDPMYPQQHFPAPGKSPFMDMPLVPKYQESTAAEVSPAVQVSQGLQQNLGVRLATVAKGQLARTLQAVSYTHLTLPTILLV